jgi:hypothetical protein
MSGIEAEQPGSVVSVPSLEASDPVELEHLRATR